MARTITFQPSKALANFVELLVDSGAYNNQSEVIREGLRLLQERAATQAATGLQKLLNQLDPQSDSLTLNKGELLAILKQLQPPDNPSTQPLSTKDWATTLNERCDELESMKLAVQMHAQLSTLPVSIIANPYVENHCHYLVIGIDPCNPEIREVAKGTPGSAATLADAKELARQMLQSAIAQAKQSQIELRQTGIDNIGYISL